MSSDVSDNIEKIVEQLVPELNRQVGNRVRSIRKSQRLSRRELSEISGVSPRYLATLEAGEGNISVGLLTKLSVALDTPTEYFVTQHDSMHPPELMRIIELYKHADEETRAGVLQLLDPDNVVAQKRRRICLVGLRGAGKSTLGAHLGKSYDAPFIELNAEIATRAGMPVGEIIELYGLQGYRQLEAETLLTIIATYDRVVVAAAGGIVSNKVTYNHVLTRFHTVWLKASPDEHMNRVQAQGDLRPMQDNPEAMTQLKEILNVRESSYGQADHVLDTAGKTVQQSQTEISTIVDTHDILVR